MTWLRLSAVYAGWSLWHAFSRLQQAVTSDAVQCVLNGVAIYLAGTGPFAPAPAPGATAPAPAAGELHKP